ncbi:hypothetical protein R3Q06_22925 [Rhodococcus erythropolis]|uniref:hypothetical protein n=1 Tax=Rhodococcus erythropolis TaxID=1833 RepID=UPI002949B0C2|nr:hypothetical protein [Rhodococcus erythropolis]MDV6276356.1 hypothetical protein [Rhodococcus erythropolis]
MSTLKDRRERVGRWAYAPLVVVIAAGAIGGGMGVGSADTDTAPTIAAAPTVAAPASTGDRHWWSLYNDTGQPISGEWTEQVGNATSGLTLVKDIPEPQGGHESRPRINDLAHPLSNPYWWGHICYDHKKWNLDRQVRYVSDEGKFTLVAHEGGGLDVTWDEVGGGVPYASASVTRTEHLVENTAEGSC